MVAIITPSQPSTGQLKINHKKRSPVKKMSWTEKESQSRNAHWRKICSRGCHEHLPIVKCEQMLAICGAGCDMSGVANMNKMQERKSLSLAKAKCKNQVGLMCDQPRNVECERSILEQTCGIGFMTRSCSLTTLLPNEKLKDQALEPNQTGQRGKIVN